MNGIISWWARNSVAANLAMVGILIMGILAYFNLERETFPSFHVYQVEITVQWPGAAPQEVEEQLILKIEEALVDLDNVKELRSFATEGNARIFVEAYPTVKIADFINEVKLRVDSVVSLPPDIYPPRVRERVFRETQMLLAVYGDVDERVLKRAVDRARDQLALQPGVTMVRNVGTRAEEVSIELSETALRRYGLTFDEVVQAIRASSVNLSSGTVRTPTGEVQLRTRNLADTKADFERIVVRQTAEGAAISVGDVATVDDGFVDFESIRHYNNRPGAILVIESSDKVNVVQTSRSVRKWLAEPKPWLPEGVVIEEFWDLSKPYFDRMKTIGNSAFYGLILVFIVLILFLRPKVAVWVSMGIATAFAGALIFLPASGVSLNMLSLFAFLLVIGIVVDDAIIVGESIHRQVEEGGKGVDAAILGTQLVLKPVIFAVLTTIIAFAPWMFLSGAEVQIVRQISLIVIFALSFSLFEALLILPSHLSDMKPQGEGRFTRFQRRIADSIVVFAEKIYRPIVRATVARRWLTTSFFSGMLMISFALVTTGHVKSAFQPAFESELIQVQISFPEGTPFERAAEVTERFEASLGQVAAEGTEASRNGKGIEWIQGWYVFAFDRQIFSWIKLAPSELRDVDARTITNRLREVVGEIPDAEEQSFEFTFNRPDKTVRFAISSPDLEELRAASEDLKVQLATYDDLFEVRDDLVSTTDEIQLKLRPGAEKLGLTLRDVSRQVRQAYYGEEVQRLPREGNDVRVMVRYARLARRSLDSLQNFRVRTADGREVPLFSVAEVEFAPGLQRISRRDRQRSAIVVADVKGESQLEILKDLNDNFFPGWQQRFPSVKREAIGAAQAQGEFLDEVTVLYIAAFLFMYALLAIAFGSYFLPVLIMTAIPFGFMGAVFGHLFLGMTLQLFSFFGIGAAAGVVVNDNLVLVDYVNRLRDKGMGALDALVEAGVTRFRPILLTSVTTFVGVLPIMLEQSMQSQDLKPTAVALAFGIFFATFVTLLLVPALYGIGVDTKRYFRWWFRALWAIIRGREIPPRLPRLGEGKGSVR